MATPTFSKIALRWSCTVHGDRYSRAAMASVGSPRATSRVTSRSRSVRRYASATSGASSCGRAGSIITATRAPGSSPSTEARTTSQRPDLARTRARAIRPSAAAPPPRPAPGPRPPSPPAEPTRSRPTRRIHAAATSSVNVIEPSGASTTTPAAPRRRPGRSRRGRAAPPAAPSASCRRHRFHQRGVGGRERLAIGAAQHRQRAPRRLAVDERRAQLIAEAVRAHDLPVALAAVQDAAGGLAERRHVALRHGERAERDEVLPAKLDLLQPRVRRRRRAVLEHRARRQCVAGSIVARTRRRTAPREQGSGP